MPKPTRTDTNRLPGFTLTTSMPEGYYVADAPNENIREFISREGSLYDIDTDDYEITGFDKQLTIAKRKSATMDLHVYWSKKHHDAIRHYINHFTSAGDIVFDPFSGSGGTAFVALTEGRKAIATDLSPAATFITKHYCTAVDVAEVRRAFNAVEAQVKAEIDNLYETRCDRCDGPAIVGYTVYSQVFQCPRCVTKLPLYDCVQVEHRTKSGKPKSVNACPYCHEEGHIEVIRSQSKKYGSIPVLTSYLCKAECKPQRAERGRNDPDPIKKAYFEKYDLPKIAECEQKDIPHWFPTGCDMTGFSRYQRDALFYYGVEEVSDLFTRRNLRAIAAIREACKEKDPTDTLQFILSSAVLTMSRMCRHDYPSVMSGAYYMPQINRELNVWDNFSGRINRKLKGIDEISHSLPERPKVMLSCQSATRLHQFPDNSIDYIFTDPPYAEKVQYGELNFVWEAWLGFDTSWHDREIIVNPTRGKTEAEWAEFMRQAMAECYRVLKPGRWLSLCYHDTSEGSWGLIQDIMAEVGFLIDKTDTTLFIDTGQKSFNQLNADKTTKRDLVLNFRKPRKSDSAVTHLYIPEGADRETFRDMGRQVIQEFLTVQPGATKDKVYDELVGRMMRRGEMEAHNFDELLNSVAEEVVDNSATGKSESGRWYLKATSDQLDKAEQDKEDACAARIEEFMEAVLHDSPESDGVHYSDLFEQIVNIPTELRPRRLFENWLPEYFFKTSGGTWRPPSDEAERQQKAAIREAGTLRRMKRFANALLNGVPLREQDRPDSTRTLAEWIRQCRRAGLYEQGRALYEKGGLDLDRLEEDEQIEVEDDYRICVKRGSEDEGKKKSKSKGRKKKS